MVEILFSLLAFFNFIYIGVLNSIYLSNHITYYVATLLFGIFISHDVFLLFFGCNRVQYKESMNAAIF